nr:phage holin family protein [uncultured Cohaesibacter sp.]
MKRELKGGLEDGLLLTAAFLTGLVGLVFALIALFILLDHALGALNASIIMAALAFIASALVLYAVARRRKRRARVRAAARASTRNDMATLQMVYSVVRSSPLMMMALGGGIAAAGYVSRKRPSKK